MVKVVTAVEVIDDISHNWLFCREIYALFGVLFAGLNNVVAYQNTENDKYQACPFVNVLIPLQVVFPEKENNV